MTTRRKLDGARENSPPDKAFIALAQQARSLLGKAHKRLPAREEHQTVQQAQARHWCEHAMKSIRMAEDCWYPPDEEGKK